MSKEKEAAAVLPFGHLIGLAGIVSLMLDS
jgi:hypothetical protein